MIADVHVPGVVAILVMAAAVAWAFGIVVFVDRVLNPPRKR